MDDCQKIGGGLMAVEYQMVFTLLFHYKIQMEMFQLTWILLVKLSLE